MFAIQKYFEKKRAQSKAHARADAVRTRLRRFVLVPENVFLAFAGVFGVLLVFATPPMQAPDEQAHFIRAYQVSNLTFVSPAFQLNGETRYGSQLPASITAADNAFLGGVAGHSDVKFPLSTYKNYLFQPLAPHATQQTIVEASGVYSPVIYVPQAIGITIGKIFHASPLVMIWLGRLFNLGLWLFVISRALRLLPFAKWAVVVLALNPVAVFLSASLSPDVTNISFAFLFVSLILATVIGKKPVSRQRAALIIGALAVLALSKQVNLVFAVLLFAIPWRQFGSKAAFARFCALAIGISGLLFAVWNYTVRNILIAAVDHQGASGLVSDKAQFAYVIHHPVQYLVTIFNNYILVLPHTAGDAVLTTFFGVFGWLDTSIPFWTMLAYLLLIFTVLLYQVGRGITLTRRQQVLFMATLVLGFVGNITAMYLNSSQVGSSIIQGVQGRYFLAFSILVLALFVGRRKILAVSERAVSLVVVSGVGLVLVMTVVRIIMRYY